MFATKRMMELVKWTKRNRQRIAIVSRLSKP